LVGTPDQAAKTASFFNYDEISSYDSFFRQLREPSKLWKKTSQKITNGVRYRSKQFLFRPTSV
jgi:nucleotide-binding universal stress UspA family protein